MKFTAAGDMLIQKVYTTDDTDSEAIGAYVRRGDARFFNLETTLNRVGSCCASAFSGGSYLRADPEVLDTAKSYGFNMTSFNNNHTLDFSYGGLLHTLETLEESGLAHTGVGRNLEEASRPAYLDTPSGRVALIAVNSTFNPAAMAGETARDFPGRPGINPLRHEQTLVVTAQQMEAIKDVAKQTQVNASEERSVAQGYSLALPDHLFKMGPLCFELGDQPHMQSHANRQDLARIGKAIDEAREQAEYVLISVHGHETEGVDPEQPAQFLQEFAHFCIDRGAHAVIGHGPHLIRPVEIYQNRPIFYSLGDFVLQLNDIPYAPEEFYAKYGLSSHRNTIKELLDTRSANGTRGLMYMRVMMECMVPYWEMENGEMTYLELLPVELGFDLSVDHPRRGIPRPALNADFMQRIEQLSAPMGVQFTRRDGKLVWQR